MIVFELQCANNHRFEGWFASGDDFDAQQQRGLLSCPSCGEARVSKLLTAKIGRSESASRQQDPAPAAPAATAVPAPTGAPDPARIRAFVEHVLANSENVGKRFAQEARRIHQGDAPERSIRGEASADEVGELLEEGIGVLPLPVPPQDDWH
jgi:hypothetical protein